MLTSAESVVNDDSVSSDDEDEFKLKFREDPDGVLETSNDLHELHHGFPAEFTGLDELHPEYNTPRDSESL